MSTNWMNAYGQQGQPRKYQTGGPMEGAPAPAPAGPEAGPGPEQGGAPDIEGMLSEYAQTKDPQLAVAIADLLVEMMAQGGGQAAPMARNGARMVSGPIFKR